MVSSGKALVRRAFRHLPSNVLTITRTRAGSSFGSQKRSNVSPAPKHSFEHNRFEKIQLNINYITLHYITLIIKLVDCIEKHHKTLLGNLRKPFVWPSKNALQWMLYFLEIWRNFAFLNVETFEPKAEETKQIQLITVSMEFFMYLSYYSLKQIIYWIHINLIAFYIKFWIKSQYD